MYARKYLLYIEEIFYLNIQEPVSNNIHPVHHSPRSPFTFSLSLFHLFLSFSFPFPLLSPPPFIPLYLTTSGTKTEKKPGQLFRFSQKCINFAAIKKQI